MKPRTVILFLALLFATALPSPGQTLVGMAAGDFYSAFAKMAINEKRLTDLEELKPFIPANVTERLKDDLIYRAAFIGFAVNQYGVISGKTSSVGFYTTLNAITGFLMLIEENGEIEDWTIREISRRYEQLLATSWHNINQPLFMLMLESYCSYKRGELWADH
jgi:hypothetical protein